MAASLQLQASTFQLATATPRHKPHFKFQPLRPSFLHRALIQPPIFRLDTSTRQRLELVTAGVVSRDGSSGFRSLEEEIGLEIRGPKPLKFALMVLFWAAVSVAVFAASGEKASAAAVAADSIRASGFGVKIATALRQLGWLDEAVVFALATLPVIELRGAIPVGYWMRLSPVVLTALAVAGNMVPVPFIILYLKRFATFLAGKEGSPASRFLNLLFTNAKKKAGPVEEFQWLGLMLFIAVPFPGTGAWTGAIIASILDMPFWSAFTANFFGVVLAGILVNLIVNLGLRYAVVVGIILFFISTSMWSILRRLKQAFSSSS